MQGSLTRPSHEKKHAALVELSKTIHCLQSWPLVWWHFKKGQVAAGTELLMHHCGRFDAVVHFAGRKAVGESVEKPMLYYTHNIVGAVNLIEAMRKHNLKKVPPSINLYLMQVLMWTCKSHFGRVLQKDVWQRLICGYCEQVPTVP